ncbi:MAG: LysR family transcriptional regulator [Flavobacteriaceae bacterium]
MLPPAAKALPLLDTDVLRSFVAIVDSGSFRAAADCVLRTPSAVSMQIKKLEETLGRPVFERDARNVRLTADGELLLGYARRILAISDEAMAHFHIPEVQGVVSIGSPDEYGERVLPGVLQRLALTHPGLIVNVVIDSSKVLIQRLDAGEIDLTLYTCDETSALPGDTVVFEEDLVWAGVRGGTAHLRDPLPVSMWEEGCAWRACAVKGLDEAGRAFRISYMSAHTTGQRAAILSDLAIAPYPAGLITPPLVRLGEKEGLPPLRTYKIAMRTNGRMSEAAQAVSDQIMTTGKLRIAA